eukprot:scaffold4357_cov162-Pinguiococcus_pyrenoidosus.AAC.1
MCCSRTSSTGRAGGAIGKAPGRLDTTGRWLHELVAWIRNHWGDEILRFFLGGVKGTPVEPFVSSPNQWRISMPLFADSSSHHRVVFAPEKGPARAVAMRPGMSRRGPGGGRSVVSNQRIPGRFTDR